MPETYRVFGINSKNEFEKLVHLVSFFYKNCLIGCWLDKHSPEKIR